MPNPGSEQVDLMGATAVRGGPGRVEPCLVADRVSIGYGSLLVVEDVSLQVGYGEAAVILGPNGAGKSTLVKGVTGQLPLSAGSVRFDGRDVSGVRPSERIGLGLGYVPQVRDVFPTLSVMENLEMGAFLHSKEEMRARVAEVLELFPQLSTFSRRRAGTLSGGERKLLGIARALMGRPRVLILDEPTSNLSPKVAAQILEVVVDTLATSGHAVLMIEQRVELALQVATWGYVLVQGQVRHSAPVADLRAREDLGELFLTGGGQKAP